MSPDVSFPAFPALKIHNLARNQIKYQRKTSKEYLRIEKLAGDKVKR